MLSRNSITFLYIEVKRLLVKQHKIIPLHLTLSFPLEHTKNNRINLTPEMIRRTFSYLSLGRQDIFIFQHNQEE